LPDNVLWETGHRRAKALVREAEQGGDKSRIDPVQRAEQCFRQARVGDQCFRQLIVHTADKVRPRIANTTYADFAEK